MGWFKKSTKKEKKYRWEPYEADIDTIFELIEQSVSINAYMCRLIIKYKNEIYRLGITCAVKWDGRPFDIAYYINDNEYKELHEFKRAMIIDSTPLEDLKGPIFILEDEDVGDPRCYTMLSE